LKVMRNKSETIGGEKKYLTGAPYLGEPPERETLGVSRIQLVSPTNIMNLILGRNVKVERLARRYHLKKLKKKQLRVLLSESTEEEIIEILTILEYII